MKKNIALMLALVLAMSALAACGSKDAAPTTTAATEAPTTAAPTTAEPTTEAPTTEPAPETTVDPANIVTITVNIKGWGGNIETTDDGTEPKVDPEFPMQSSFLNVEKGTEVKIIAEPEEGYHFYKWLAGNEEYSTDALITVTAEEDTDFLAWFLPEGKDGKYVDLSTVTTIGDVYGLPELGAGTMDNVFVYAFEQDGNTYRAIADITDEITEAIFALDFDDPEYDKKYSDIVTPLEVRTIENLTESIPTQEEADKYIGKNGQEMMDEGWYVSFMNLNDMEFGMNYGPYYYTVIFEGEVKDPDNFDEYNDMAALTVKSITCDGVGDATSIIPEE